MNPLVAAIVPLAMVDSTNPVTIGAYTCLLTAKKPVARALAYIAGVFLTYFAAGFAIAAGLGKAAGKLFANPDAFDYGLQAVIGFGLLWAGWRLSRRRGGEGEQPAAVPKARDPLPAFFLGVGVIATDIPFALLYFAALDRIIQANLRPEGVALALLLYNALYILPLALLLALVLVTRERSEAILERINRAITKWGMRLIVLCLFLAGALLVADSVGYFLGRPLLPG